MYWYCKRILCGYVVFLNVWKFMCLLLVGYVSSGIGLEGCFKCVIDWCGII